MSDDNTPTTAAAAVAAAAAAPTTSTTTENETTTVPAAAAYESYDYPYHSGAGGAHATTSTAAAAAAAARSGPYYHHATNPSSSCLMPPYNSPTSLAHPYTTNPYAAAGHNPFVDPYQGSNSVARRSAYSPYPSPYGTPISVSLPMFVARVLVDNISFCPFFATAVGYYPPGIPPSPATLGTDSIGVGTAFPYPRSAMNSATPHSPSSRPPLPSPTSSFDGSK